MKRLGKIAVGFAGGLALNSVLCAPQPAIPGKPQLSQPAAVHDPVSDNPSSGNNPFAMIAKRNVFGLVPPAPPPIVENNAEKDLPKITPEGIMGIFGDLQVLFKVAPAKPDPKAKDQYYTLSEGQMQDDIEVLKIDNAKSMVTFNNHGTTQELPLAEASASGGLASSGGGRMNAGMMRGAPGFRGNNGPGAVINFGAGRGGRGGGPANGPTAFNGGPPNAGMDFGNSSMQNHIYQPPKADMTPEQAALIIEAQRAALMSESHPAYSPNLLPTTPLTKYNTDNSGPPAP